MRRQWKPLVRSGALKVRIRAADLLALRAACGLAAAAASVDRRAALRIAEDCARRLERQRVPWTTALAELTRAGAVALRGHPNGAISAYRRAAEALDAAQLPLHAAAARLRLGELLADQGLIADAEASLARRGVAEPERMARLLAPDCRMGV
jgi:hypothetical protein